MSELILEVRGQKDETPQLGGGTVMITPPISEEYWSYRVKLFGEQAIVGFPKFFTIGIGFAVEEEDWNANLPYSSSAESICDHIWHNRKYDEITREDVISAIRLIQERIGRELTFSTAAEGTSDEV